MHIRNLINLFEDKGITDEWFSQGAFETYKQPNPERHEFLVSIVASK
jgi:hypothetical protein